MLCKKTRLVPLATQSLCVFRETNRVRQVRRESFMCAWFPVTDREIDANSGQEVPRRILTASSGYARVTLALTVLPGGKSTGPTRITGAAALMPPGQRLFRSPLAHCLCTVCADVSAAKKTDNVSSSLYKSLRKALGDSRESTGHTSSTMALESQAEAPAWGLQS